MHFPALAVIQFSMCPPESNAWISVVGVVAGALVGATAVFIPNMLIERYRFRRESLSVKAALIAEIDALVEIADERKYLESIAEAVAYLETQPEGATCAFEAIVPAHYSRIYQANAHRVGLLASSIAVEIVKFHQLLDAAAQDVSAGGVIADGGSLAAFRQNHQILSRALSIGRKLARDSGGVG